MIRMTKLSRHVGEVLSQKRAPILISRLTASRARRATDLRAVTRSSDQVGRDPRDIAAAAQGRPRHPPPVPIAPAGPPAPPGRLRSILSFLTVWNSTSPPASELNKSLLITSIGVALK